MVNCDAVRKIQLLNVERRLERVERLLKAAADEARGARIDLGRQLGPGERWARMMFGVLQELEGMGGEVSRRQSSRSGKGTDTTIGGWLASTSNSWSRDLATRHDSPPPGGNVCTCSVSGTEVKRRLASVRPKRHTETFRHR